MEQSKRRRYRIDLNGPPARTNLKLLALLYPVWGLIVPLNIVTVGYWYYILYTFLIVALGTIYSNRIFISKHSICFAHNLFKKYPLQDLVSLSTGETLTRGPIPAQKELLLFNFNGGDQETITLDGMDRGMKAQLMTALDNLAPSCQKPRVVRDALLAESKVAIEQSPDAATELKYDSRFALKLLKEMAGQYEGLFWKGWAICMTYITALTYLIVFCSILPHSASLYGDDHIFVDDGIISALATPVTGPIYAISGFIYNLSQVQIITYFLHFLSVALICFLYKYLDRPNALSIDQTAITLKQKGWGAEKITQKLLWNQLSSVYIDRQNADPDRWQIILKAGDGSKDRILQLGALGSIKQQKQFINSIQTYAQRATLDPELLAIFEPAEETTYTSLWLSSLAMAPAREKLAPLGAGQLLKDGTYIVDEIHAAGGQGQTYLAVRAGLTDTCKNQLILKETIIPVYTDSQETRKAIQTFERDAKLLADLKHPQIVKLVDYFIEDHRAYLVLERVAGKNLRQLVNREGPLAPSVVLHLAKQMADILDYLHRQDPPVIHRDFTPENLMIDILNHVTLIDFGVAQQIKSRTTATVVGKHAYLPPEQLRGKVVPQSDLYAMAATLYFLLTGSDPEPLSRLNPLALIEANQNRTELLAEDEFEIAKMLSQAIENATALDCARRTASASAFLVELTGPRSGTSEWPRLNDLAVEA